MGLPPLSVEDLELVLAHTQALWPQVRDRRVFLTGGTGFFGPWLVETFAYANDRMDLGAELVVLTRDPDRTVNRLPHYASMRGVSLWRGDVRAFEWPPGEFDVVVHGAAESSQQTHAGDHRHMFDTIIDGTRQTLGLARARGTPRYLLLSSGAIYGPQPPAVSHVMEEYQGAPDVREARSAYAEGKRAAEALAAIESETGSLSVRVARCFAFVGPHLPLDVHFAIGNFIRDALAGGPIRIAGDGTAIRTYLYMADLAIWVWSLALSPAASGAYNVGSETALTILDVAEAVARVCAPDARVEVAQAPRPGGVPHRYVPSTVRARKLLGFGETVALDDAIRRTAEWHRASGAAFPGTNKELTTWR